MMLKLGFDPKWVEWIRMSTKIVVFNVLVNGTMVSAISPRRGLRVIQCYFIFLFFA